MKRRRVVFSETARDHVRSTKAWWIENSLHPHVLAEEIDQTIVLLSILPGAGTLYEKGGFIGLRRIYLRRLTAHLYYPFTDDEVLIRALWHAKRRRPTLKR